jgi:hypothetical protein
MQIRKVVQLPNRIEYGGIFARFVPMALHGNAQLGDVLA